MQFFLFKHNRFLERQAVKTDPKTKRVGLKRFAHSLNLFLDLLIFFFFLFGKNEESRLREVRPADPKSRGGPGGRHAPLVMVKNYAPPLLKF